MAGAAGLIWCCSRCGAIYYKDFPRCPSDGAEVVVLDEDPLLGTIIGHYKIDELIGEGGMGRVYAARHTNLPAKRYAIKVLLGDAAVTGAMRKRFTREAENASRLDHPNIISVLDYGEMPSGLPYLVMDFVDGSPLSELTAEPMEPSRVIRIGRAICEGLAHAHDAGVIHRDLKPENVMITIGPDGDERPRIGDFGLAVSNDPDEPRVTSTGTTMGTPAFAAPEQMAGRRVDHRADLYTVGMTMFEMLTGGKLPFEGSVIELAAAKLQHRDAPTLFEVAPHLTIPPTLAAVVARLLARDPNDRFRDARELIEALDAVVLDLAVDPRATTVVDPIQPAPASPRARTRTIGIAAGVVVLGLVGGMVWPLTRDRTASSSRVTPAPATSPDRPANVAPGDQHATPDRLVIAEAAPDSPDRRATSSRPVPKAKSEPRPRKSPAPKAEPAPLVSRAAPMPASVAIAISPPPEVPPPQPAPLHATIAGIDVHGALPVAEVQRAVQRTLATLDRCNPTEAQSFVVHFRIGESRRAEDVRAFGGAATTNGCVAAALRALRIESAPDVGDVEVTVRVAYAVGT